MQTAALTDWRAGFHLFGYNDKTPWSADGRLMLGLRTALSPRDLGPGDSAQIGLIPFAKGARLHAFLPSAIMLSSPIYQPGSDYATWALATRCRLVSFPWQRVRVDVHVHYPKRACHCGLQHLCLRTLGAVCSFGRLHAVLRLEDCAAGDLCLPHSPLAPGTYP